MGKRETSEEFFNITEDPECMNNLADKMEYQELKQQLKDQLFAELKDNHCNAFVNNEH